MTYRRHIKKCIRGRRKTNMEEILYTEKNIYRKEYIQEERIYTVKRKYGKVYIWKSVYIEECTQVRIEEYIYGKVYKWKNVHRRVYI